MLRFQRPDLFEIAVNENLKYFSLHLRQTFAAFIDSVIYVLQTNVEAGVLKVAKSGYCIFKQYELLRIDSLENQLLQASEKSTAIFEKVTRDEKISLSY